VTHQKEISMKIAIGIVLALALTLAGVPAFADDTFQAFSTLPAAEQATLTPLPDDQLAAVAGAALLNINVQVAVPIQLNVCVVCEDVVQTNVGVVVQGQAIR
jgi:hypothetical protein